MRSNAVRMIVGILLAIPVAVGLFAVMHSLIDRDFTNPEAKSRKVAEIVRPDEEIETNTTVAKPEKVEDPKEPPPEMAPIEFDMNPDIEVLNTAPSSAVAVEISATGMSTGDGEYLPIVKVAPIYPRRAQTRGITGYCTIEYTVTTSGAIRDPVAIDCEPSGVFEKASLKASLKFKYKPRVVDGEPIEVAGVQNRFTYELEQ